MKIDVTALSSVDIVALTMVLTRNFGVQNFALTNRGSRIWLHLLPEGV